MAYADCVVVVWSIGGGWRKFSSCTIYLCIVLNLLTRPYVSVLSFFVLLNVVQCVLRLPLSTHFYTLPVLCLWGQKKWSLWFDGVFSKVVGVVGLVIQKVVLGAIFFLALTPLAFFYRLFSKDPLMLKTKNTSTLKQVEGWYDKDFFERMW